MKKSIFALAAIIGCAGTMAAQQNRPASPNVKVEWQVPSEVGQQPVVTLTITMPDKFDGYYDESGFVAGGALDKIDKFELTRSSYEIGEEEHLIYSIDNPVPGQTYVYKDTEAMTWGFSYNWGGKVVYDLNDVDNTTSYPSYTSEYIGIRPDNPTVRAFSDKGAAPFGLDITLPTTDILKGELVGGLTKVVISRSEGWAESTIVEEITEGVQPGASFHWIDSKLTPAEETTYVYYVTVVGPYGKSYDIQSSLKLGRAFNPSNIYDIKGIINDDNTVSLSWKMDEIGYDGGYVPFEDLRFTVKRKWLENPTDWQYVEKIIAEDLTEMAFTDNTEDITEVMTIKYEIIAKYVDADASSSNTSYDIVLGPPYNLPFTESFYNLPEGSYSPIPDNQWMSNGYVSVSRYASYTDANGQYVNVPSRHDTEEDNTDTWLYFFDAYSEKGGIIEYMSHRIDIKDVANPVLSLWRFARPGQAGRVEVFADLTGKASVKVGEISFYDAAETETGWTEVVMPLEIPEGNDWMSIRFVAHSPGIDEDYPCSALCIDDIKIADYPVPYNLSYELGEDLHASLSWNLPDAGDLTMTALEVHRNGIKIADLKTDETSFTDAVALRPRVSTKYAIMAVYDGKIPASADIEAYTDNFIEEDYRYCLDEQETASVVKYLGSDEDILIPEVARDYSVVAVGSSAFAGNETILTVSFPTSVTKIGEDAFNGCKNLNKATFTTVVPPVVEYGAFEGIAAGAKGVCPTEGYVAYVAVENLRTLDFSDCTGVSEITDDMIEEIKYFSVDGKRLASPEDSSVVIRHIRLTNGDVVVDKVVR